MVGAAVFFALGLRTLTTLGGSSRASSPQRVAFLLPQGSVALHRVGLCFVTQALELIPLS